MKRLAIAVVGLLPLAACGHSAPTRFFTLDPVPTAAAPPAVAIAPVQLDAVHIPPALDRPEVVSQAGPNRLEVSDFDHWGAPLGEMMRRTLAQDLLARMPGGSFVLPDAPRPAGVRGLVVDILVLRADAGGGVTLQGSWSLLGAQSQHAVVIRDVQLSTALGGGGAPAEAEAISQLLGRLADQISAALATGPARNPA